MVIKLRRAVILALLYLLVVVSFSYAASGAFRIFASDAEAIAKGGAFAGEADNPSAMIYNPAGLTQLKGANHISIGAAGIRPGVKHTDNGVETQMRQETFLLPHIYYVTDFGLENWAIGIGSTTTFGLSTDWSESSFARYNSTRTDVENIDNLITLSYQLNDKVSFGLGGIYSISKLNKEKAIAQGAGSDALAQVKGSDNGPGYTVSAMYQHDDHHQFGLLYRSEIDFKYKGSVNAFGLNNAHPTTPYATIFGGTTYATNFVTRSTLPQSVVLGYSFTPNEKWRFNIDVEWMDWSSIESEHTEFPDETDATRLATLDALTKTNRDWVSTVSPSIGIEYAWSEDLMLRGGYFYNPTPIPEENFDTTVADSNSHGLNLGFGYLLGDDWTVDMAYTVMLFDDRFVSNTAGIANGGDIDGTYENIVNIATATLTYQFP